jgi:hypothetical protein
MNNESRGAGRLRLVLLAFALSCIAADLAWVLGDRFIDEVAGQHGLLPWATLFLTSIDGESPAVVHYLLFFGGILLAQWLFLRPRGDWRVQLAERARPMKSAIAVAAFMAMLLSVGAIATILEVFDANLWNLLERAGDWFARERTDRPPWAWYALILASWSLWAAVFYVYWREGERSSRLGRMIAALVAGSLLELVVAVGVYAWNPQNDECWCGRGSFTGIVFGATVMIWAFGPGLLLLFLRRQREQDARRATRARR